MYAIVDIETTGGHASANGITDIAIVVYDGQTIVRRFHSLVNPGVPIPYFIQSLTGISNEMVQQAPPFHAIAAEVYEILRANIFVAHNVNFDYSFIKYHLSLAGYDLQCKKLCTIRLGRKIFPGMPSYSLGKLCHSLQIPATDRHRAAGDAEATTGLFRMLLSNDQEGHVGSFLNRRTSEQQLPPNLRKADIDSLPKTPGVYYFKDSKGSVIYVGKAVNVKKRVLSHFTGNKFGRQRQEFLKNVFSVSYRTCGTELMALILEAAEIKRLWPANNRAMKRYEPAFGLYAYEDQLGYVRLVIDKKRKNAASLYSFNRISEGYSLLQKLIHQFELCPHLCFVSRKGICAEPVDGTACRGACRGTEPSADYNTRAKEAISEMKATLPSFLLIDSGRTHEEKGVIRMNEGRFDGMGYVSRDLDLADAAAVAPFLELYPSNDYIRNIIMDYAAKHPERVSRV
ncbi:exonuclease domain-containing protein [Arcticibacter sp.]|uniref:exonuclease domain-containing protein n=1 Tax=Arcticibacter sp. TaxID=1872630 RepID=UPI00388EB63A